MTDRRRCDWGDSTPDYVEYHDTEWGVPVHGDNALFERLTLEGFQSGLSWLTILRKRENFRAAFAGFDIAAVAQFGEADRQRLLADVGIVRNRAKIEATIANARAILDNVGEGLTELLWSYAPSEHPRPQAMSDIPPVSPESKALAKELKRRGLVFLGPTTVYAAMQAVGIVDDHVAYCWRAHGQHGAGLLHRLTSADAVRGWETPVDDPRLRQDLVANDPDTMPPPVKGYPEGLPTVPLPRQLPAPGVAATAVLAGLARDAAGLLDAGQLGRVLYLGAGVVRTSPRDWGQALFRAAGSAGGRFPLEVYASTRGVEGLPDAVYWYDPVEHALVRIGPAADGVATTLVVTGVPWRTGWRYAERGWRHIYWDAGTLLAQLGAAADSAGLRPRLRSLFPDASLSELVGADGVHEFPVALLTFGDQAPAIGPTGPALLGSLPAVEFPLCTAAQRAGDAEQLGEPWPADVPLETAPESASLDAVILRRGSQRRMDRRASLPRAVLDFSMHAALRGIRLPHWVAVHAVDGVEPGLYRWPDLAHPVRTGDLRDELARVCMAQSLAAEACFVTIAACPAGQLDDRGYRTAQLAAGIVEGRLHLAAYALGATATGMTFYDSEIPTLLGQDNLDEGGVVPLLFTCVGVGEYTSRAGGLPGTPVEVRAVQPRFSDE